MVREDTATGVDDGSTVDLVQASVGCAPSAFVERLTLTGSTAIGGTGNELANMDKSDTVQDTGATGTDTIVSMAGTGFRCD